VRQRAEYAIAGTLIRTLGLLPRGVGGSVARGLTAVLHQLTPGLCAIAEQNLRLASFHMPERKRHQIIRGVYANLARVLNESAHFPQLNASNVGRLVSFEGLENYEAGLARGNGVIFLTAHLGVWELGAFAHALRGYKFNVVYRGLDNPRLDQFVRRYRALSGNRLIEKNESARGIIAALARNETVGILADQNTLAEEGVFVEFFGVRACMTAGVARFALHTGAAVVPAFCVWEADRKRYCIYYDKAMTFAPTANTAADIQSATQAMAVVIERYIRRYPDQWLWIHRRWKTRPPGEPPMYQ
jgi:Kdo2-lipid IVA lauroyltransferase/acyltransferase